MGKKILIVEDDPNVLQSMHVRLRAHHYEHFFRVGCDLLHG